MNRAITGNMSNLLVVVSYTTSIVCNFETNPYFNQMKAVKKFKSLLNRRRPGLMNSILGQGTRIVQPPLTIDRGNPAAQVSEARSVDASDRRPLEGALATEGVHRPNDAEMANKNPLDREDLAMMQAPAKRHRGSYDQHKDGAASYSPQERDAQQEAHRPGEGSQPLDIEYPKNNGKGQAHNPLDELIMLEVGPFASDDPPDPPAVSDSPPASEINIYETAYHDEIERIRERQGSETSLYLTRRVEHKKEYQEDENLVGANAGRSGAQTGFAHLLQKVRQKDTASDETSEQQKATGTAAQQEQHQ